MGFDPRYDREQDEERRPGPGGFLSGRLIAALVMAAIAVFMYYGNVQENPVTGEKQRVAITPAQEIKLGLESAPQMSQQMGGELSSSDPRAQEVKKIGNYIVDYSIVKKSPWKFQFHLLADDETVNAFALPGGQIFITMGLANKLQNEAELAGVLSHEIGHVLERHSAQQMATTQLGQMLVMAAGTAASDPNQPMSGRNTAMVAAMVNQMLQLRYSRGDESEADLWGLKLMEQAGYDPKAMITVMEVLQKSSGGRSGMPQIFQTHPNPGARIKDIESYLEKNPPKPGLSEGKSLRGVFK